MGRIGFITVIGTALLAGACGASKPAPPTWMPARCGQPPLVQRPSVFSFSCDANVVFTSTRWMHWGESTATATATLNFPGDCIPDCASAPRYQYQARVVASEITPCGSRRGYGLLTAYLTQTDFRGDKVLRSRLLACV